MSNFTDLPKGWSREEVVRKSGLSAGKTDIYYHGPDGRKYRSKPQIARELGEAYDLSAFDFKSGRMMSGQTSILRKTKGKSKAPYDHSKGFRSDSNLTLPVRQTASIFKQPVTVIRNHPESKVRADLKHGPQDAPPPRQLFWERSLTGLMCCDINEEVLKSIDLPSKIQGIGPDLSTENLVQSIAAALHLGSQPVVGQSQSAAKFMKNPTVHINTNQPLIQQVYITDDDILQQQGNVTTARKKLEELLAAIETSNREQIDKEFLLQQDSSRTAPAAETANPRKRKSLSPSPSPASPKQTKTDSAPITQSEDTSSTATSSPQPQSSQAETMSEPPAASEHVTTPTPVDTKSSPEPHETDTSEQTKSSVPESATQSGVVESAEITSEAVEEPTSKPAEEEEVEDVKPTTPSPAPNTSDDLPSETLPSKPELTEATTATTAEQCDAADTTKGCEPGSS